MSLQFLFHSLTLSIDSPFFRMMTAHTSAANYSLLERVKIFTKVKTKNSKETFKFNITKIKHFYVIEKPLILQILIKK